VVKAGMKWRRVGRRCSSPIKPPRLSAQIAHISSMRVSLDRGTLRGELPARLRASHASIGTDIVRSAEQSRHAGLAVGGSWARRKKSHNSSPRARSKSATSSAVGSMESKNAS
jgi:hypothetical protein